MINDFFTSLRACEAIQKPDVPLDCFVPRNDVKQSLSLRACEAIQVHRSDSGLLRSSQ